MVLVHLICFVKRPLSRKEAHKDNNYKVIKAPTSKIFNNVFDFY